jgi:excisionase family DNA binding protein
MSEYDRATVTVPEAARILGIGRASAYEGVRTGAIPSLRLTSRKIVVPRVALERLLARSGETK